MRIGKWTYKTCAAVEEYLTSCGYRFSQGVWVCRDDSVRARIVKARKQVGYYIDWM